MNYSRFGDTFKRITFEQGEMVQKEPQVVQHNSRTMWQKITKRKVKIIVV